MPILNPLDLTAGKPSGEVAEFGDGVETGHQTNLRTAPRQLSRSRGETHWARPGFQHIARVLSALERSLELDVFQVGPFFGHPVPLVAVHELVASRGNAAGVRIELGLERRRSRTSDRCKADALHADVANALQLLHHLRHDLGTRAAARPAVIDDAQP